MCLKPIMIKNVNYGNTSRLAHIKDTTSQYIPIPCGRCSVCLQLKQQYITQRVQMESLSHDLYFGTLTYNNEALKHVISGHEFNLAYADITDWQNMIKQIRLKEDLPHFKYIVVTEYGGRRHRPHFHFLLSFPKDDRQTLADRWSFEIRLHEIFLKYWRRNRGSDRYPLYQPLCTYVKRRNSYNYDLHYLDPWASSKGVDDVAFYVTKYCLKYDKWLDRLKSKLYFNLDEDEYKRVWEKLRPRRLMSKGFGSVSDVYVNGQQVSFEDPKVIAHLNKGIDVSLKDPTALFPYFISPVNGNTFPLAPYFSKKLLTLDDLYIFNSRKPVLTDDDMMVDTSKDITLQDVVTKDRKFQKIQDDLWSRHTWQDDEADSTNVIHISNFYTYAQTIPFNNEFDDCFEF